MKKMLFMGDSLTSGENNSFTSYVQYLDKNKCNATRLAVSGTTIGEYSLYPVDGFSLVSQVKRHKMQIASADVIFLEYGVNDASAIIAGNVTYQQVLISFIKALDAIKQTNPEAEIKFLALSSDMDVLFTYARYQHKYLKEDYFKGYDIVDTKGMWALNYARLMRDIAKRVEVIPMILDVNQLERYMDRDNIHPNDTGYKKIAEVISPYILPDTAK